LANEIIIWDDTNLSYDRFFIVSRGGKIENFCTEEESDFDEIQI